MRVRKSRLWLFWFSIFHSNTSCGAFAIWEKNHAAAAENSSLTICYVTSVVFCFSRICSSACFLSVSLLVSSSPLTLMSANNFHFAPKTSGQQPPLHLGAIRQKQTLHECLPPETRDKKLKIRNWKRRERVQRTRVKVFYNGNINEICRVLICSS